MSFIYIEWTNKNYFTNAKYLQIQVNKLVKKQILILIIIIMKEYKLYVTND